MKGENEYRYALGEVQEKPNRLLFCIGINPGKASPEDLDPTAKRIRRIAKEHGYDSWIILNVCAQRATNPNNMDETQNIQNTPLHKKSFQIITELFNNYRECSDVLFAYGDLILEIWGIYNSR